MISQTAEYALRTMVWLASRHPDPQTTRQIADAAHIPAGYLAKVLQSLVKAGLVNSQRGLHGGFTLTHEPSEVTALAVIDAIDPIRRLEGCPLGLPEHSDRLCPLHQRLDDAMAHIEAALRASPISELTSDAPGREPLRLAEENGAGEIA